jgi:hypothetical protein
LKRPLVKLPKTWLWCWRIKNFLNEGEIEHGQQKNSDHGGRNPGSG